MNWHPYRGRLKVLRAIAFIVSAAFIMSAGVPPCFAGDDGTKPQATKPAPKKPEVKTRGFQKAVPQAPRALGAVPPAPSSSGDGGGAEDTLGGLPGHNQGPGQDRQP